MIFLLVIPIYIKVTSNQFIIDIIVKYKISCRNILLRYITNHFMCILVGVNINLLFMSCK